MVKNITTMVRTSILEEVKQHAIEPLSSFFQKTNFLEIPRFISYDNIFFQEYQLLDGTTVSVGITKRKHSEDMHILIMRKTIKEIQENIDGYLNHGKKMFNPMVLVIDFKQKRWLKVKSELENYTDGMFYINDCGKVFTLIVQGINQVYIRHKRISVN